MSKGELPERVWRVNEGDTFREWVNVGTPLYPNETAVEYIRADLVSSGTGPSSVASLEAWTSIDSWLRDNPNATAAECVAELVERIKIETTPAPASDAGPTAIAPGEIRLLPCPKCLDCKALNRWKDAEVSCGRCGFNAPFEVWQSRQVSI